MKREYKDHLQDMLENAEKAISFIGDMSYNDFALDDKAVYAVIRALEIIGEAARQIPEKVRDANPEVPWREITGMRNKLHTRIFWRQHQGGMADSSGRFTCNHPRPEKNSHLIKLKAALREIPGVLFTM